jgi:hypothetical protein
LDVTYGDATAEKRRQVRQDLEKYCGLDTEGMIWIVENLKEVSEKSPPIGIQTRLNGL